MSATLNAEGFWMMCILLTNRIWKRQLCLSTKQVTTKNVWSAFHREFAPCHSPSPALLMHHQPPLSWTRRPFVTLRCHLAASSSPKQQQRRKIAPSFFLSSSNAGLSKFVFWSVFLKIFSLRHLPRQASPSNMWSTLYAGKMIKPFFDSTGWYFIQIFFLNATRWWVRKSHATKLSVDFRMILISLEEEMISFLLSYFRVTRDNADVRLNKKSMCSIASSEQISVIGSVWWR